MSELYPLKFKPIFKEKLWGGQKIRTILGKDFGNMENCGESWELSGVEGNISIVSDGELEGTSLGTLVAAYRGQLVGDVIYKKFGNEFPLLIKFIDAAQDLSIQVHPDDELARKRHNSKGKSELWYIIDSDDGSSLISGFSKSTNKEGFLKALQSGNLESLLNKESVEPGDAFYLPAGRVHTIGKGLLLAEIQQTSDITYRIFDFDRVDKDGNKRELHIDQALDAIDFETHSDYRTKYPNEKDKSNAVLNSPFFTINKLIATKKLDLDHSELDCFKIYIAVGGSGKIAGRSISFGEVVLVPATLKHYSIEPEDTLELLESYIQL